MKKWKKLFQSLKEKLKRGWKEFFHPQTWAEYDKKTNMKEGWVNQSSKMTSYYIPDEANTEYIRAKLTFKSPIPRTMWSKLVKFFEDSVDICSAGLLMLIDEASNTKEKRSGAYMGFLLLANGLMNFFRLLSFEFEEGLIGVKLRMPDEYKDAWDFIGQAPFVNQFIKGPAT